jgi:hypothetical protein
MMDIDNYCLVYDKRYDVDIATVIYQEQPRWKIIMKVIVIVIVVVTIMAFDSNKVKRPSGLLLKIWVRTNDKPSVGKREINEKY